MRGVGNMLLSETAQSWAPYLDSAALRGGARGLVSMDCLLCRAFSQESLGILLI